MLLRRSLRRRCMESLWELQAWSIRYFIASHPFSPLKKYLGPIFFNFAYLFLGKCTPLLFLS